MGDQHDVAALAAADHRFRRLYHAHLDPVTRYFVRRMPLDQVADATADVFLVAWRRVDEWPIEAERRPWLFGIARNVLRNARRSTKRGDRLNCRMRTVRPPESSTPEGLLLEAEEHAELRSALESLRERDREVLYLRAFEELSIREIAIAVGCSEHAAKQRVSRALARLRTALGATHVELVTRAGAT